MIQCKPPVTHWHNNLSLAAKRPVRIKSPVTRVQYLREVTGFRSAGHICIIHFRYRDWPKSTVQVKTLHTVQLFASTLDNKAHALSMDYQLVSHIAAKCFQTKLKFNVPIVAQICGANKIDWLNAPKWPKKKNGEVHVQWNQECQSMVEESL